MPRRGMVDLFLHRPRQLILRRLNFQIHLWLGILLTLYLVVIGLSGSLLVFRSELERLGKPHALAQKIQTDVATVVHNVQTAYPDSRVVSVNTPSLDEPAFVAVLDGLHGRTKIACRPSDGSIIGEIQPKRTWLDITRDLHASLLFPRRGEGRMWNGIGAACLLLLNLTGLVIWWPGIRLWKRALKVDWARGWRRINFDLHVSVGFWTLLISSFWAVSAIYFAWPRQTFLLVDSFSKIITARPPAVTVTPPPAAPPDPDLAALVAHAHELDPGTSLHSVVFPYRARSPLAILLRRRDAPGYEYVDTVYFNPYDGSYISTWRYGVNQSLGDWLIWLEVPLHFGTYWGLGVKIIWGLAGLAIPLLSISGVLMYWNRALRRRWKRLRASPHA